MRQTGRSDPFWKKYGWSTRWMCFSYSQWADLGSKFTSIFDIICLRGTSVNLWSCSFISAWLSEKYSSIWSFSSSTRLPDWRTPFWKKNINDQQLHPLNVFFLFRMCWPGVKTYSYFQHHLFKGYVGQPLELLLHLNLTLSRRLFN